MEQNLRLDMKTLKLLIWLTSNKLTGQVLAWPCVVNIFNVSFFTRLYNSLFHKDQITLAFFSTMSSDSPKGKRVMLKSFQACDWSNATFPFLYTVQRSTLTHHSLTAFQFPMNFH